MQKKRKPITVVLDIMGADVSPNSIMEGGLMAAKEMGDALKLVFVGKQEVISDFVNRQKKIPKNIVIEHAAHAVAMSDIPA